MFIYLSTSSMVSLLSIDLVKNVHFLYWWSPYTYGWKGGSDWWRHVIFCGKKISASDRTSWEINNVISIWLGPLIVFTLLLSLPVIIKASRISYLISSGSLSFPVLNKSFKTILYNKLIQSYFVFKFNILHRYKDSEFRNHQSIVNMCLICGETIETR